MTLSIAARGVVVTRGAFRLGPLDLAIADGEYLVLVGPSGAGKTLLVETLLGFTRDLSGAVLLDGAPVTTLAPAARQCAYLPQDLGILPHLSVGRNLTWGLDCARRSVDGALLDRVVAVLGLGTLLTRTDPRTLSRGEQQRVALGRALLTRPRRLFLDEPCAAVDPHARRELQLLLRALHTEFGTTVVHVTHDREEAFLLGHRIAVLLDGRLHQIAAPDELYRRPADLAVARFTAGENLWPATITEVSPGQLGVCPDGTGARLAVADAGGDAHRHRRRAGSAVFVGVRPEEVAVMGSVPDHADDGTWMDGEVEDVLRLDGTVQIVVVTDPGLRVTARMPTALARRAGVAVGRRLTIALPGDALYVLWE